MLRIDVCYHVKKKTAVEAMDVLIASYMRKFKGDWVASDYAWSKHKRWFFWPTMERCNTYIIAAEDLENVKALLPSGFYINREDQWPFMSV